MMLNGVGTVGCFYYNTKTGLKNILDSVGGGYERIMPKT